MSDAHPVTTDTAVTVSTLLQGEGSGARGGGLRVYGTGLHGLPEAAGGRCEVSKATERRPCAHRVFSGERGDFGGHMCQRAGAVQEAGKWWCRTHAPAAVEARSKEREKRWAADDRRASARYAVEMAEAGVLHRVRESVCMCDPELVRLRDALLAADRNREAQR